MPQKFYLVALLKWAIDQGKAISIKFFIRVLNYPKRKKHPSFIRRNSTVENDFS